VLFVVVDRACGPRLVAERAEPRRVGGPGLRAAFPAADDPREGRTLRPAFGAALEPAGFPRLARPERLRRRVRLEGPLPVREPLANVARVFEERLEAGEEEGRAKPGGHH